MQKSVIFGSGHEEEVVSAKVGDALIWKEYFAKLLGVLIHFDLSFTKHVKVIRQGSSYHTIAAGQLHDFFLVFKYDIIKLA